MRDPLDSYYFGFRSTGNAGVDSVLAAVASAGKYYHSTEFWADKDDGGTSQIDKIQNAANMLASVTPEVAQALIDKEEEVKKLREALDQAIEAGSLSIVTVVKDKSYDMWRYEGTECIVGQSCTENFFAGHLSGNEELVEYMKAKAALGGSE